MDRTSVVPLSRWVHADMRLVIAGQVHAGSLSGIRQYRDILSHKVQDLNDTAARRIQKEGSVFHCLVLLKGIPIALQQSGTAVRSLI